MHIRWICTTHPHYTQNHTYLQAAVFKHLCYHWQDCQKFTSGCNKEEIDSAISKFETQMRQLQATTRDATIQSKQDEKSVPRFYTATKREERVMNELEWQDLVS